MTPSTITGFVAAFRGFRPRLGSGTPSGILGVLLLATALVLALLAPGTASAAFTRPFLRQLAETPSGSLERPRGVAVDAADNLWLSELDGPPPWKLDQFAPAYPPEENAFLQTLEIAGESPPLPAGLTRPESLAVNRSNPTYHFYTTAEQTQFAYSDPAVEVFAATGSFVKRFGPFGGPAHVAVDNSSDPSAGPVYVAHGEANPEPPFGDGKPRGIEKFNATGVEEDFEACPTCSGYVEGDQITGIPGETFGANSPQSIAVDSHGNIYAVNGAAGTVDEYKPSGEFVRAFTGAKTPGLGGNHEYGGFGAVLSGIAVDPVSEHVLISLADGSELNSTRGAVDEFDSSGRYLNQITGTSAGGPLRGAFQMTTDSHGDLYLVGNDAEHAVSVYGPGHFLPSLKLAEASERKPTSALLNGEVDPEGLPLVDCRFEYVTEAAFKATGFSDLLTGGEKPCIPPAASIPVDSEYHPVHAEITGLTSGTTYRYRLTATTSGELGATAASASFAFTAPHAPRVVSTSAANLSSTFADLRAQIDPLGADTTYQFQYVDQAHYEPGAEDPYATGSAVPAVPADIGSGGPTGSSAENVIQQIGGLQPGTTYHFRVLASNECEAGRRCLAEGPDATFATLPQVSPGLPDGRAYELVTPPNKGSAEDMFIAPEIEARNFENNDFGYSSESGGEFLLEPKFAAFGPFPASGGNAYVFSRTCEPTGSTGCRWTFTSLVSPSLGLQSVNVGAFNRFDFSQLGVNDHVGSETSAEGSRGMELAGSPGGPYTTLHTGPAIHLGESEAETPHTQILGASHDLSRVILESNLHDLAPGDEGQDKGTNALYEWDGTGECMPTTSNCKLVNVNSAGRLLSACGAIAGQSHATGGAHDAVSADGSRVIFTAPDPYRQYDGTPSTAGCWQPAKREGEAERSPPQLYMRVGGTETLRLSAPEAGWTPQGPLRPAIFVGASEDGSKVFFITETELSRDDAGIHDPELYECEVVQEAGEARCRLTRVSAGESGRAAAHVWTVPAVSADGSAVYFTAFGALANGAKALTQEADGPVNLYRYDTDTRTTSYVGTVSTDDYANRGATSGWWSAIDTGILPEQVALQPEANWYTTPNGRYLVFSSLSELTGYSTLEAKITGRDCPGLENPFHTGHCKEVYRYDAEAASNHEQALVCVSCDPNGAPPISDAFFGHSAGLVQAAAPPVRAISNDGSYVFFDSADPLVPQDGNSTLDVYEWHNGTISPISSGQDSIPSFFLGMSGDGANVFFGTHAKLVPQDTDVAGDVYDARVCTASDPCISPPPNKEGLCEGDACSHPVPAPAEPTLSTSVSSGRGNVHEGALKPRCAKGKVLRRGKCVVKHHKKRRSHKRANNSRGGHR